MVTAGKPGVDSAVRAAFAAARVVPAAVLAVAAWGCGGYIRGPFRMPT